MNDVTALRGDPELAGVVADAGAYLCLMHMQGKPRTMQQRSALRRRRLRGRGIPRGAARVRRGAGDRRRERICLDPGIGFGKTAQHNFELVRRLDVLLALGRPVLIGFSRKSSLGRAVGDPDATTGPLSASVAAAVSAYERGASILRVHDVREHVEALAVARAIADAMITVELRGLRVFGHHGVREHEQARRAGLPLRRRSRRSASAASPTGSRTQSTTARSRVP